MSSQNQVVALKNWGQVRIKPSRTLDVAVARFALGREIYNDDRLQGEYWINAGPMGMRVPLPPYSSSVWFSKEIVEGMKKHDTPLPGHELSPAAEFAQWYKSVTYPYGRLPDHELTLQTCLVALQALDVDLSQFASGPIAPNLEMLGIEQMRAIFHLARLDEYKSRLALWWYADRKVRARERLLRSFDHNPDRALRWYNLLTGQELAVLP